MSAPYPTGFARSLARLALLFFALQVVLVRSTDQRAVAIGLRVRLERLGGVWVKLGQALALRRDLLPPVVCEELSHLLDSVPPFPSEQAVARIERELGRPIEALFDRFEREPIASASMGQVHVAWAGGRKLAVKVQRPGLRMAISNDFKLMASAAAWGDRLQLGRGLSLQALFEEFRETTWHELDYRREAGAAHLMRSNAAPSAIEAHVASLPERSSARVLTMEYATGEPLPDLIRRTEFEPGCADVRVRVAEKLVWNTLNQIYRFGLFHADPHPANIFVQQDGSLLYVDHGQVGRLRDSTQAALLRFATELTEERFGRAVEQLLTVLRPTTATDIARMRRDVEFELAWHVQKIRYGTARDRREEGALDLLVMNLARHHRLAVPSELTLYLKCISTADSVVRRLAPELDTFAIQHRFFIAAAAAEWREALRPERVLARIEGLGDAVEDAISVIGKLDARMDNADELVRIVRARVARFNFLAISGALVAGGFALWRLYGRQELLGIPLLYWVLACLAVIVLSDLGSIGQVRRLTRERSRSAAGLRTPSRPE